MVTKPVPLGNTLGCAGVKVCRNEATELNCDSAEEKADRAALCSAENCDNEGSDGTAAVCAARFQRPATASKA